jgi:putative membrane protein
LPEARSRACRPAEEDLLLDIGIRVLINAVAFIAAVYLVPRVGFSDVVKLVIVAAIFGLVNAYLRPIVKLLSLPLTLLTFGLVGLIINTGMVVLTAFISDNLKLGFKLADWPPGEITLSVIITALLVAVVVSLVSALLALVRLVTPRI